MAVTEEELLARIRRNDETIFRIPVINWPVSVNKIHAVQYGTVFGFFVGLLFLDAPSIAVGISVSISLLSFGLSDELVAKAGPIFQTEKPTLFIMTVQHKPHYFLVPYAGSMFPFVAVELTAITLPL